MIFRLAAGFICAFTVAVGGISQATTSGTLTLTTYNIHSGIPHGHSSAGQRPSTVNLHNVADVLTTTACDIIGLQEVRSYWSPISRQKPMSCPIDMPLYLASLMDMHYAFASTIDSVSGYPENRGYLQWGTANQWTNNGAAHGEYGNAILSRLDLVWPPTMVKLPRGDAETIKDPDEPRNAIRVEVAEAIPGLGRVVVYNTHFQHNNGQTREKQMAELLRHATADATTATVFLMGDFNHYPHEGEPDLLEMIRKAGFHDLAAEFAEKTGTEPAMTMPADVPNRRIDYIFASKDLKVLGAKVLQTTVSDHLPLTVTIDLQ